MHDGIDGVRVEQRIECYAIGHVAGDQRDRAPGQRLNASHGLARAVDEVIDDHDVIARLEQGEHGMRADIARAAGHEDTARTMQRLIRQEDEPLA